MTGTGSPLDVEVAGDGPDLVLLHGGAGSRDELDDLRALIGPGRRVIAPDQRAHGRSPDLGELSYPLMAADTAGVLDELGVNDADIVGFSDGGIVALLLARDRPALVGRVVAIGANVSWDPPAPRIYTDAYRTRLATVTAADLPLPDVRRTLPGAAEDWPAVVEKYRALWLGEPGITLADLAGVGAPVLYVVGDGDTRVEHTVAMFRATPGSQLAVVPGTGHDVPRSRPAELAAIVLRFLELPPPQDETRPSR
jgi:pimeloyl-ACP methyl ester carboxylesterase